MSFKRLGQADGCEHETPRESRGSSNVVHTYDYIRPSDLARFLCEIHLTAEQYVDVIFYKNRVLSTSRRFDNVTEAMAWADAWRDATEHHLEEQ